MQESAKTVKAVGMGIPLEAIEAEELKLPPATEEWETESSHAHLLKSGEATPKLLSAYSLRSHIPRLSPYAIYEKEDTSKAFYKVVDELYKRSKPKFRGNLANRKKRKASIRQLKATKNAESKAVARNSPRVKHSVSTESSIESSEDTESNDSCISAAHPVSDSVSAASREEADSDETLRSSSFHSHNCLAQAPIYYVNPVWPPSSKQIAWRKRDKQLIRNKATAQLSHLGEPFSEYGDERKEEERCCNGNTIIDKDGEGASLPAVTDDPETSIASALISPQCCTPTCVSPASRDGTRFLQNMAYLMDGVSTRRSTLGRAAGLGLFADRNFKRNAIITEYAGITIDRETALELRNVGAASHVVRVGMQHSYINGYNYPFPHIGGGSFANDGRLMADGVTKGPGNNAHHIVWYDHKLGKDRVFLKAIKNINAENEIFIGYHNTYWKYHESPHNKICR